MRNIFVFLKNNFSANPTNIDRLIISAFLKKNNILVKNNKFISTYIILESEIDEFNNLRSFISVLDKELEAFGTEELIKLFEFVISPADRIINGAIYTPLNIRNFIIEQAFKSKEISLENLKIADISCGCGGFLFNASKRLKEFTNRSYFEIFSTQIFGLDIQNYSIDRTKLLLSVLALSEGEDIPEFRFNFFVGDALAFKWNKHLNNFTGFDIIIGNPPYVCARNLSNDIKLNLHNWSVCKSGNSDLYIPFFQIGIENLSENGILGFITMNTFFKSLNGRSLRQYFQSKNMKFKIIDFGTQQIFKSKSTYTCICFIENCDQNFIRYYKCENKELPSSNNLFTKINYTNLDSKKGWNLQDNDIITKIESIGIPFGKLYKTRHGIATLKNDIYIFKPINEDNDYYYLQSENIYPIEKGICKSIINSNKLSRAVDLDYLIEKVIFPYDDNDKPRPLDEKTISENFPSAYRYLLDKRYILDKRDKGKGEYANWFAFGRTQSLEKIRNKMFFPKFSDRSPNFLICNDENMLFYNGQAIVGHSPEEMEVIKKIMESKLFWYYIKTTSKPYSSNYFSLNGNYIKNFGICDLSREEIEYIINEQNKEQLDLFFESKYNIVL